MMNNRISLTSWITSADMHHSSRPPKRGKKARIQLIDEDLETSSPSCEIKENGISSSKLPTHSSGEPTQESKTNTIDDSPIDHPLPESSSSPPRLKHIVERIVSSPVVSYFSCSDSVKHEMEEEDMDFEGGSGSVWSRCSSSPPYGTLFSQAIQTGAPKIVVQSMKQFPYQSRIQRMGCGALKDMAIDSWPRKVRVVDAGSIETIIKAMRIHLLDAKLQELACACFYELVAGNLADLLIEKGAVASVLSAMEAHPEDEDVLPLACDVLLALTDQRPGAVECLRHKLGGVLLAKVEHFFRGRNGEICRKSGELLKRLYL